MKEYVWMLDVEWAHCDAAGIVFYPNFYTWFDQATGRLFKANGLSYPELKRDFDVTGMPLVETGATYKNKCTLGDTLELTTWVDDWQDRTYLVKHRVMHADGRPALEGFERRVFAVAAPDSPKGMRAMQIPQDIIDRFLD